MSLSKGIVSEWLRREIRNLLGSPAQVRILSMSLFLLGLIRSLTFLFVIYSRQLYRFSTLRDGARIKTLALSCLLFSLSQFVHIAYGRFAVAWVIMYPFFVS
jgi:hypothetical protein